MSSRSAPSRLGRWTAVVLAALASAPLAARPVVAQDVDCASTKTHCVGAGQEFVKIQSAVDRAKRGHTVVVFSGDYQGFRLTRSGSKNKPITVFGMPGARIVSAESGSDEGIYLQRVSYVTVEGFEVDGSGTMGRGIGAHDARATKPVRGVEILRNTVHDAYGTNIYVSNAADSLVEGNVAYNSWTSHGIYLANGGSDRTVLRANRCYENAKNGIHFNGDESVGGDGLHQKLLVEENVLYRNAANGFDADGVQDSVFGNNLVYDNGRHGLRAFAIDAAAGPADLIVVNNTFEGNGGWAVKLTQDEGGHTFFNNILLSKQGSLVVDHSDGRSDYNIVQSGFSLDGENTTISFAEWKRTGGDAHSVRSKAKKVFQSIGKEDYRLRKNSPAIDLGMTSLGGEDAPPSDIVGTGRPQGKRYDAGAYERVEG